MTKIPTAEPSQHIHDWIVSSVNACWDENFDIDDLSQIIALADEEGMTQLVYNSLVEHLPGSIWRQQLQSRARQNTACAMLLQEERQRVLHHLEPNRPLILKGEALAYACYKHYQDRPMVDLDLLIDKSLPNEAEGRLIEAGYQPAISIGGNIVMPQKTFSKNLTDKIVSVVDLHTELFNRPALQGLLSYYDLSVTARRDVHPFGFTPRTAYLLIHAALHLLAHHFSSRRLIWLYDIKLLLDKLDEKERKLVISVCGTHKIAAAVLDAIDASTQIFPHDQYDLIAELRDMADNQKLPHITGGRKNINNQSSILLQDWKFLRGGRQRCEWLRQHLAPPPDYMRRKYDLSSNRLLPFFYLWRILKGSVKLIASK